jgi:hypothetical protein
MPVYSFLITSFSMVLPIPLPAFDVNIPYLLGEKNRVYFNIKKGLFVKLGYETSKYHEKASFVSSIPEIGVTILSKCHNSVKFPPDCRLFAWLCRLLGLTSLVRQAAFTPAIFWPWFRKR